MRLLVAGADRVDAGKTTFSTGLVHETGATGYKPRAGNDYWFDHDDYRRAVDAGRLYGKDARRLAAASPGDPDPEDLNPVHRLWVPVPGPSRGLLGQEGRAVLVDRVGGRGEERWVRNATTKLPASVREALPIEGAVEVSSVEGFNDAMRELHVPATEALGERIAATDRAVVESYADVARPLEG
ncbi:MAG: ATPase, partial [Haloarculaceae archaeon]